MLRESSTTALSPPPPAYPWRAVLLTMLAMLGLLVLGTWLIDAGYDISLRDDDPQWQQLSATCYYIGDARHYTRIAMSGYSSYIAWLGPPHFTYLNDRSWWPLFPNVAALLMRSAGTGACTTRTLNGICFVLLVPLFQALTGERRVWRLLVLAILPFGSWLYIGQADTFFLVLSGVMVLVIRRSERRPLLSGLGAFGMGLIVGLAKPNALSLLPALGVWGFALSIAHARTCARTPDTLRHVLQHALSDRNPGWAPLLAALGITLSLSWWVYQTSGYYPFYVLMLQRAMWWREFRQWSLSSFAFVFNKAVSYARGGLINLNELYRLSELINLIFGLALTVCRLPPTWPNGERLSIPLHWRVGVISGYVLMFASGQSHGIERYMLANVFAILTYYRLLFGAPDQPVSWRVRTLPGLLRWILLIFAPVTWALMWLQLTRDPFGLM
ncbi:MAG: hypothetical protein JW966_16465 [Anaerolineae bacterium]|nr:hypothetical protein [Anaerolineae bacterium]